MEFTLNSHVFGMTWITSLHNMDVLSIRTSVPMACWTVISESAQWTWMKPGILEYLRGLLNVASLITERPFSVKHDH